MMEFDLSNIDPQDRYKLATGSVVPRPIALVSTLSEDGKPNLAPYSFFTVAAFTPLVLAFFPLNYKKGTELKDTVKNILETKEFVIHITTESLAKAANLASGMYPYGENEFELTGLTPIPSVKVKPFRIKEAPIQFECKLYGELEIGHGEGGSKAIFGEVVYAHIDDELFDNFKIDPIKLKPVARLAGVHWSKLGELISMERPVVK